MKNKIKCPYFASGKKKCTHRDAKMSQNGKNYCIFNDKHKCPLFREWEEYSLIRERCVRIAENGLQEGSN